MSNHEQQTPPPAPPRLFEEKRGLTEAVVVTSTAMFGTNQAVDLVGKLKPKKPPKK